MLFHLTGANGQYQGYDFVFGVPGVTESDTPHVMLSTASPTPIFTIVIIPGTEFEVNNTLTHGDFLDLALPTSVYIFGTGKRHKRTIVVRSSGQITVHVMANEGLSGDGFLVLPTSQLGTHHYVISYRPTQPHYYSFICMSAFSSETTMVAIRTNSQTHDTIILQKYESYQLLGSLGEDLSGSRLISNHPITVIAGTQCSFVGGEYCDALVELMPPVELWGTHVVMSPFKGKDNGYVFRVLGTLVTTEATISNDTTVTLTEGQWYEGNVASNAVVVILSDYPILVMQYIKGGGSSSPRADPSMIFAPPTDLYTSKTIVFPVFNVTGSTFNYYVHIITECNKVNGLMHDNASIASWERLKSVEMCSVRGEVTAGAIHEVSHEDGNVNFIVAVYGLVVSGHAASYAYLAGIGYLGMKHLFTIFCGK